MPRDIEAPVVPVKKIAATIILFAVAIFGWFSSSQLIEALPADEVMVIQYPNGSLKAFTEPGFKAQWFGSVTHYKRRAQFWFSEKSDQGVKGDESIKARFNDGGHGNISGSLSWEMPSTEAEIIELHRKYGSQIAVEQQIVRVQAEKSVYMTGSLMSSKESAAEKRPELLYYIEDQLQNGVYRTENQSIQQVDHLTSMTKTVIASRILKDATGVQLRVEQSLLRLYNIRASSVAINQIRYDDKVEAQIQAQQQAIMDIQTAIAEAKKAEQRKLTVESEGQAVAAKAKWEQEAIKAKEVTKADQEKLVAETNAQKDLEVAKLNAQSAAAFKEAETLKGEGEAARRKLVMEADGALEKKLEAWVAVSKAQAEAMKEFKGSMVPSIVMGSPDGQGGSAADFMNLLTAKAARDISLDLGRPAAEAVAPSPKK